MRPKGLSEASEISANHGADEVIRAAAIGKQTRLCLDASVLVRGALLMSWHVVPSDVAAPDSAEQVKSVQITVLMGR